MKKITFLVLLVLLSLGLLKAQTSFKLNPYPNQVTQNTTGELNLLAVMVEFKTDNDGNTFGNGKFGSMYSQDYGRDILDPLPHDVNYFGSHLEFAKNYFTKVSDERLNINYTVLPNIITVSKIIREYSPEPGSETLARIGNFAEEVWQLADQAYPDVQFEDYDMFVIFHAGVGKEIPTPGSIGLERDIPSVYLSERGLKEIFGAEFEGFPVNNGSYLINNTAILPSTENREIESFGDTFLQEFTINGLIVGTIASHLGLPDLFNTETGTSAIGRFGLMDGQALFAYSGLFPPEPSAWEKIYLGWIEPREVDLSNQSLTLTAYETASAFEYSVVKIPINANEYYLIENRKRDANKDGITLTYKIGSATNTITFDKDYPSFSPFGADTIAGVVTDIDEFDWALPGFEEEQLFDDPFGDVGLIIWHIDETVIKENLETNTINNDRDRLGVRVIEADGIFDIGEEFTNIFGDIIIGEGTKQDTWYNSNPSDFYENRFNANTKPPAVTNLGANSLINIENISSINNVMTFDLSFGNNNITRILNIDLNISGQIKNLVTLDNFIAVHFDDDVYFYDSQGVLVETFENFTNAKPVIFERNGSNYLIGSSDNELKVYSFDAQNALQTELFTEQLDENLSAPLVVSIDNNLQIFLGSESGRIYKYNFDTDASDKFDLVEDYNAFTNSPVKQIVYNSSQDLVFAVSEEKYWNSSSQSVSEFDNSIIKLAVTNYSINDIPSSMAVVLEEKNNVSIVPLNSPESSFSVNSDEAVKDFVLADIKFDRSEYVILPYDNLLDARNIQGSTADNYPIELKDKESGITVSQVLASELNGDDYIDLLVFDDAGNIYAIDGNNGRSITGFPISSGSANAVHPVLQNDSELKLYLINEQNELVGWSLGTSGNTNGWYSQFANNFNNAFYEASSRGTVNDEFFPVDRAYNWPNPVYEDETHIRFYVNESADITIKIFDLAGDLVDEITDKAVGGLDNEVTWNVSQVQSGVYFAHLNVAGVSGKTENKIIKIAVIK